MAKKALFIDRDGVLNPLVESSEGLISPQTFEDFRLFEGVESAIREAKEKGYLIFVVSNQPDVSKDWRRLNSEQLERMNGRLEKLGVDDFYICTHGPEGGKKDKYYRKGGEIMVCDCRKPQKGLIDEVASEYSIDFSSSYIIGDKETDIEAGKSYEERYDVNFSGKLGIGDVGNADRTFDNFKAATGWIVGRE